MVIGRNAIRHSIKGLQTKNPRVYLLISVAGETTLKIQQLICNIFYMVPWLSARTNQLEDC